MDPTETRLNATVSELKWLWHQVMDNSVPPNPKSDHDISRMRETLAAKLRELSSADKDRDKIWHALKSCQSAVRHRETRLQLLQRQLIASENDIESLVKTIADDNEADCNRLRALMPRSVVDGIGSQQATKDELYEILRSYIDSLHKEADANQSVALAYDMSVLAAERDAAYAEVRVLQARVNALCAVPGKSKNSPHQYNSYASAIASPTSLDPSSVRTFRNELFSVASLPRSGDI